MGLRLIPRRPVWPRREGYLLRSGRLVDDLTEFLVDEVCERYASGDLARAHLEPRIAAALAGDWQGAGWQFRPARLEERHG